MLDEIRFFIICEIDQSMTPNQKYSPKPGPTDHLTWSTSTMVQDHWWSERVSGDLLIGFKPRKNSYEFARIYCYLFTVKVEGKPIDTTIFIFITSQIINLACFFIIEDNWTSFDFIFRFEVPADGCSWAIIKELNSLNTHLFRISNFDLKWSFWSLFRHKENHLGNVMSPKQPFFVWFISTGSMDHWPSVFTFSGLWSVSCRKSC